MASKTFISGTLIDADWLNDVNDTVYGLPQSTGAALVGSIDPGTSAVETTISEIFARTVSVYDFMTTAQRADFVSGTPVLDHAPAFNLAIAALNGRGRVMAPRKRTGKYLFKSTINLGSSTSEDSNIILDFEPGVLVDCTMPNLADNVFMIVNYPGHFNHQGIRNLHAYSTNGNGRLMKFNGQCWGSNRHIYAENFSVGIFLSNEGTGVFNEFIQFDQIELHLNTTGILMMKDGDSTGTDTSMHGISFRNTTFNVGAGQTGYQNIDVCWYNCDLDFKFFSSSSADAIIKVQANAPTANKGVFASGSVTCEGDAAIKGNGRFWVHGRCNFDQTLTDELVSTDAWEQGFMCDNYIKEVAYGSSGMTVAEVQPKSLEYGTTGPVGSFARLRDTDVEALLANSYTAHATSPGNGFYTGYTGYQQNYSAGALGWFLASDGTEVKSHAADGTNCLFRHGANNSPYADNIAFGIKDGRFLIGGNTAFMSGSGSPEGVVMGNVGDLYTNRTGGAGTTLYIKESGTGNTGWIAK